jgi:hypothetical protein
MLIRKIPENGIQRTEVRIQETEVGEQMIMDKRRECGIGEI